MNIDWDKLYLAYDWAKEWQVLLAGVLVFLAALVFAWATIRAAKISAVAKAEARPRPQSDLRAPPGPAANPPPGAAASHAESPELASALEQLRSLIRSALGSLPHPGEKSGDKPGEKENSPAYFLCQRILHLRIEQLSPSAQAGKTAQDGFAALLAQLSILRTQLKKDAPPGELSEILVRINTSARSLGTALAPAAERRRQASQER